jgi:2-methylcitrate dehydratase PrpD
MSAAGAATELERAAHWTLGLRRADLPEDVVALARLQRLDILAAIWAGAGTAAGRAVVAALDRLEPPSEPGVVCAGDGRRRPVLDAVYLHAVLANALEYDDFVFAGHTGQAAVGVPLALGQLTGATDDEALLAQVAANEVAGRLGAVMTAGPQQGHMKSYLHRLAAAVAACRLLRLDRAATVRALAIALSGPEYPLFPASFSPDTKVLGIGESVVAGVRAAWLGAEGLSACSDIVEHGLGLVTSLSVHRRAPPIWDRLGDSFGTQAICFKPVVACAHAAAAALAAAEIAAAGARALEAERILSVEVATTVLTVTMEGFSRPHLPGLITPVNTNFSTRRTVALTLLGGAAPVGATFEPAAFEPMRPRIAALAERVRLVHHWPYTIGLLRGVDAAIDHPGRPGIYGMSEAHETMGRFHAAFGTPAAVSLRDLPRLLRLPRGDFRYLLRRYAAGARARLPFASESARRGYVARETDLRRMAIRFSAGVRVKLDDGSTRSSEVLIPAGFAGDPARAQVPTAKAAREAAAAGRPASQVVALLQRRPDATPREIAGALASPAVSGRVA